MTENQEMLEGLKQKLGYSDEQLEIWKSNPKHLKIAKAMGECQKYKVLAEVIKSHGCGAEHNVGDKFIFSGDGCFVAKEPPGRVCLGALGPLASQVNTFVLDSILAGKKPQEPVWELVSCTDVGVENGGSGKIVMKIWAENI